MKRFILSAIMCLSASSSFSLTFPLPAKGGDVVGKISTYVVNKGDSIASIAQKTDMGYFEMLEANPGVNADNPQVGTVLIIPSEYILPPYPRRGIVINLVQMRMYYYPQGKNIVETYPVGIGRMEWGTPLGKMTIIGKRKNPTWHVPKSIKEARAKDGVELPDMVPPGPKNPLGKYAMRLSNTAYLIHSTNDPSGVGRRSSSGCVRMYPDDIASIFPRIDHGTRVTIIDDPYAAGWKGNELFLESHLPLQEQQDELVNNHEEAVRKALTAKTHNRKATIDWKKAYAISTEEMGLPQVVGMAS